MSADRSPPRILDLVRLYVAQISNQPLWNDPPDIFGSIIKGSPDGSTRTEIAAVPLPGGVEVGRDGAVYASIWSVAYTAPDGSGLGSVVRIVPQ